MNDPRNRFLLFILGLTVGAMVSGAVVFMLLNKEKTSVNTGMIEEIANKVSVLLSRKKDKEPAERSREESTAYTQKVTPAPEPEKTEADSLNEESALVGDTTAVDSALAVNQQEEEIVVKKDELIETRIVEVTDLTPDINRKTQADSLLEVVSGIKSEKKAGEKIYLTIEFWRSPVNYRGYKRGKSKLILFGIDNSLPLQVYKMNGSLLLKYEQSVYRLDISNEFRAFEKLADPAIMNLLSKI